MCSKLICTPTKERRETTAGQRPPIIPINTFWTRASLPRVTRRIMGCQGTAFWDCMGLTVRCLGKGPKVRKGKDLGCWGCRGVPARSVCV